MLEVRNLNKIYKTKKGVRHHALKDVSLKFEETGMVLYRESREAVRARC